MVTACNQLPAVPRTVMLGYFGNRCRGRSVATQLMTWSFGKWEGSRCALSAEGGADRGQGTTSTGAQHAANGRAAHKTRFVEENHQKVWQICYQFETNYQVI